MRNRSAFNFVLIIGIVNFFADLTYESARGIVGPFLGSLGASAAIVGFVAGFGELIGYALRFVSGYFSDTTQKDWFVTFTGYRVNILAAPAPSPTGTRGIVDPACYHALPDAALLDLSRRGRVDRRRFHGFRVDWISFPKGACGPD